MKNTLIVIAIGYSTLFLQLAAATEYAVGPGQKLAEIENVPWESLKAGDAVKIHYRPEPYHSKWVICRKGTREQPITVQGMPDEQGRLPVIDGNGAKTRPELNFWSEERGVIKVGGANKPADTTPAYIVIENLDIRSGRPPYSFTGRDGVTAYSENAASIFIEKGENITVRHCILHDSGNGLFVAHQSKNILIEGCYIHDNGIEGSFYEHNTYTAANGITYQFNCFGKLRPGCGGNNLKDRSAGLVVRCNWIEDGNRQLDLVDAEDSAALQSDPDYRSTFVYGNILIEHDGEGNSQMVHYGGDSGSEAAYRKGKLYFFNNTVVSYRGGNTTLFRLSTNDEKAICFNNILYTASGRLALMTEEGQLDLLKNWIQKGWTDCFSDFTGQIHPSNGLLEGIDPGFVDLAAGDFRLLNDSICVNRAMADPATELSESLLSDHPVLSEYVPHQTIKKRPEDWKLDLGAMETAGSNGVEEYPVHEE